MSRAKKQTNPTKHPLSWLRVRFTLSGFAFFFISGIVALWIVLVLQTGWLHPEQPWQKATGWNRLSSQTAPVSNPDLPFRLQWLGHSGFLLNWHGQTLLLDPNLSKSCTVVRRELEDFQPFQVPAPVDLVLISHAHFDHFDIPTLASIPDFGAIAGSPILARYLPRIIHSRTRVLGLEPFESLDQGPLTITAVPAAHGGSRFHPIHGRAKALGFMISDGNTTLYFAGDTGKDLDFKYLKELFHPQIAILPIGAFRPYWLLKPHHLSPEDAVVAAEKLGVDLVIPCHFGTFRLALDTVDSSLPRFAKAAAINGLPWYLPLATWENQALLKTEWNE